MKPVVDRRLSASPSLPAAMKHPGRAGSTFGKVVFIRVDRAERENGDGKHQPWLALRARKRAENASGGR